MKRCLPHALPIPFYIGNQPNPLTKSSRRANQQHPRDTATVSKLAHTQTIPIRAVADSGCQGMSLIPEYYRHLAFHIEEETCSIHTAKNSEAIESQEYGLFKLITATQTQQLEYNILARISPDVYEFLIGQDDLHTVDLQNRVCSLRNHPNAHIRLEESDATFLANIAIPGFSPTPPQGQTLAPPMAETNLKIRRLGINGTAQEMIERGHIACGHGSAEIVHRTLTSWGIEAGISSIKSIINQCKECSMKPTRDRPTARSSTSKVFRAHQDLAQLPVPGPKGDKYISTIAYYDDQEKLRVSLETIKEKSNAIGHTGRFLALHPETKIIRTDGGAEFTGAGFESMLNKNGVGHQITAPGSSFSNGSVEVIHARIWMLADMYLRLTRIPQRIELIPWFIPLIENVINAANNPEPSLLPLDPVEFRTPTERTRLDGPAMLSASGHRRGLYIGSVHSGLSNVITCHHDGLLAYPVHPKSMKKIGDEMREDILKALAEHDNYGPHSNRRYRRAKRAVYDLLPNPLINPDAVTTAVLDGSLEWALRLHPSSTVNFIRQTISVRRIPTFDYHGIPHTITSPPRQGVIEIAPLINGVTRGEQRTHIPLNKLPADTKDRVSFAIRHSKGARPKRRTGFIHGDYGFIADDEANPEDVEKGHFDEADAKEWGQIHSMQVLSAADPPRGIIPIPTRHRRTYKILGEDERGLIRQPKTRFIVRACHDPRDVDTYTAVPQPHTRRLVIARAQSLGMKAGTLDVKTAFL